MHKFYSVFGRFWSHAYAILGGMKRGLRSKGYTILEVMIFLAITGLLLGSALTIMNGQQNRTRFTQGLREMDAQIRSTLNEVQSGYYPNKNDFSCTVNAGGPSLNSGGSNAQGTNTNCIFLGKAMQFGVFNSGCNANSNIATSCSQYAVQTIVGQRQFNNAGTTQEVTTLAQARPTLATPSSFNINSPRLESRATIPNSLRIYDMYEMRGNTKTPLGSIGFLSTLANYTTTSLSAGAQGVDITSIAGSRLGNTADQLFTAVRATTDANRLPDAVVMCFTESGATVTRKGAIVINGDGKEFSTQVLVDGTATGLAGGGC